MTRPIIKIENLSKQYRLGSIGTGTLSNDLKRWWYKLRGKEDPFLKIGEANVRSQKGDSEYVWALKDINLEVMPGDVLGIIGKNGAGKSTLLKILSRVTGPTTGRIDFNGRIGALLEVGTGFHPELTGRENIFLNGAILGMTKVEIRSKLDEIIDFSGCERYIDTPVKRYSSGMMVRLGFAVAAHLEPEILVVDEVLAVGDAEFQKKAIGKMQDVSRDEGKTVLFVSHNMASIRSLCTKGMVLKDGSTNFYGKVDDAVNSYLKDNAFKSMKIVDTVQYHKNVLRIDKFHINKKEENLFKLARDDLTLIFEVTGEIFVDTRIDLEAQLYDSNNVLLASFCPGHINGSYKLYKKGKLEITEKMIFPENITKGEFFLEVFLTEPNIAYLVSIKQPIKILMEGIQGGAGLIFEYKNRGMIMLKTEMSFMDAV
jgi:lipopolysaccharide transport system ATP-binding protein